MTQMSVTGPRPDVAGTDSVQRSPTTLAQVPTWVITIEGIGIVQIFTGLRTAFKDIRVAGRMLRERGLAATAAHALAITLVRLHRAFVDRPMQSGLPFPVLREQALDGLTLRTTATGEAEAAVPLSPVPCKTFDWALAGLGLDTAAYHFIDIGSGRGYALLLAARHGFRALTGVEFARELHDQAGANVDWMRAAGRLSGIAVDLRHESALETELPDGPCLIFMFCPFGERVMKAFVEHIESAVAASPRPVIAVYVNPAYAFLYARPGVTEIPIGGRYGRLLAWFSPYRVRAFAFRS